MVFGFLLFLAFFFSQPSTWVEILTGFFKFGTVPIQAAADTPLVRGANVDNVFLAFFEGRGLPQVDFTLIAFIAALAAIAGSGGLTNTPISNYTRDQGWGMGHDVGAIPSVFGGHGLSLSHVGRVFEVNEKSLPRWRRWYRHVVRDQLVVWMPACFIGLALPAVLSVQFLPFGTQSDDWTMAVMTAGGVRDNVVLASNSALGNFCWFMTIFCGFLVLAPTVSTTADGIIRRWVDVFWTSSRRMRRTGYGSHQVGLFQSPAGLCALWTDHALAHARHIDHVRDDVLQHRAWRQLLAHSGGQSDAATCGTAAGLGGADWFDTVRCVFLHAGCDCRRPTPGVDWVVT